MNKKLFIHLLCCAVLTNKASATPRGDVTPRHENILKKAVKNNDNESLIKILKHQALGKHQKCSAFTHAAKHGKLAAALAMMRRDIDPQDFSYKDGGSIFHKIINGPLSYDALYTFKLIRFERPNLLDIANDNGEKPLIYAQNKIHTETFERKAILTEIIRQIENPAKEIPTERELLSEISQNQITLDGITKNSYVNV